VAREQIVIFTPLGFMPRHMESEEADGWGLSGSTVQQHRSGWTPEDFNPTWSFHICSQFHGVNFKGEKLEETYGAFFAIRNFEGKSISVPDKTLDIRRLLPSEMEVDKLRGKVLNLESEISQYQSLQAEYQSPQLAHQSLLDSRGVRLSRFLSGVLKRFSLR
jgi:hypothetical protein